MIFWAIFLTVTLGFVLGFNYLVSRQQNTSNASLWTALTPLIGGTVKGNGVQGAYQGRNVAASLGIGEVPTYNYTMASVTAMSEMKAPWLYDLKISVGVPSQGHGWKADYTGPEPRFMDGDEAAWRLATAGMGDDPKEVGFQFLAFVAKESEVHGSADVAIISWGTDLKDTVKSPPPPAPERFKAQLDFMARLAETCQSVNGQM